MRAHSSGPNGCSAINAVIATGGIRLANATRRKRWSLRVQRAAAARATRGVGRGERLEVG